MCKEIYGRETEWNVRGELNRQGCHRLWTSGEGEGGRDKSVTGPAKDKHCLHGLWLCLTSQRMPVAFGSPGP